MAIADKDGLVEEFMRAAETYSDSQGADLDAKEDLEAAACLLLRYYPKAQEKSAAVLMRMIMEEQKQRITRADESLSD